MATKKVVKKVTRKSAVKSAVKGLKNPALPKTVKSKKTQVEKDTNGCGANSCSASFHESLMSDLGINDDSDDQDDDAADEL